MTKQQAFIVGAIAAVSFVIIASWQKKEVPKTYSVTHTAESWQSELDTLRMFQGIVGYQLTRQESDQWQAAIGRMQQRIITQVQPQLQEEARKEAAKKDSTKPKK